MQLNYASPMNYVSPFMFGKLPVASMTRSTFTFKMGPFPGPGSITVYGLNHYFQIHPTKTVNLPFAPEGVNPTTFNPILCSVAQGNRKNLPNKCFQLFLGSVINGDEGIYFGTWPAQFMLLFGG